jgi:hypothetical protein
LIVFEISVAMGIGIVLGRIWQIRCDLEQQSAGGFAAPSIARIPRPWSLTRGAADRGEYRQAYEATTQVSRSVIYLSLVLNEHFDDRAYESTVKSTTKGHPGTEKKNSDPWGDVRSASPAAAKNKQ